MAMKQWELDFEKIENYLSLYGLQILGAIAIFVIGKFLAGLLRKVLRKILAKSHVDPTLTSFISNVVYTLLICLILISAISNIGVNTTSLAAIVGAAGLAIGLAFQNSLSNVASGVMLIILRPFRVGHVIEVAGVTGTVSDIDIATTELTTADNKRIIIPNSHITNDKIINYSANRTRRVDLVIGVSYEDSLKKATDIINEVIAADKRILKDPKPFVGVIDLAPGRVNVAARPWVKTADHPDVMSDLYAEIKRRFYEEGLTIPSPAPADAPAQKIKKKL